LDRDEPLPKDNVKLMRLMADLQLLTAFAQDKAYALLLDDEIVPQVDELSPREREVLAWASRQHATHRRAAARARHAHCEHDA
jgi:hypothetical protein